MTFSRLCRSIIFLAILLGLSCQLARASEPDLTGYSLEQLLEVTVTSASKYEQRASEAPSAVQIISREEIRLHGWRTLTEALNSLPGLYASNDKAYDFQGARGFQIPGDYNTRFLLLVDGQPNNDNIFQSGMTGSEGWLDMSVIERIEYIPGPGSSIYGSNAMFGVINVITCSAQSKLQNKAETYVSQLGLTGVNIMGSQTLDNTGLLMQFSAERQNGRDQTYSDPAGNLFRADNSPATDGVAHGLDSAHNRHLMMRVDHDEWSFKLINHERSIHPSSALYFTVFDDPSLQIDDGGTQLGVSIKHALSGSGNITARLGYTDWYYRATYPYLDAVAGYYHNYDDDRGIVLDGEFQYQLRYASHHLLTGLNFSRDLKASQRNFNSIPSASLGTADVNINPLIQSSGIFVQDEWRLDGALLLSLGIRLDQTTNRGSASSPRLGVIWQPTGEWTLKFLAGRAYRAPSAYESQFGNALNYLSNPDLQPETIRTNEAVIEWLNNEQTRWQLSLYENRIDKLIQQVDTGAGLQFQNLGWARVRGAELGVEKVTTSDLKLRASLSGNNAENNQGTVQENSPAWTGKISLNVPVFDHSAYLAGEAQAIGRRSYTWNASSYTAGSMALANATLTLRKLWLQGLQAQLRINNLFDRRVEHPASAEVPTPVITQDGRNLMAKLEYAF